MKNSSLILSFLFLLSFACTPKVQITTYDETKYPPTQVFESFAVIESDTVEVTIQKLIASIEIKEKGLTFNCDYETVKRMAEEKARQMGGNCLLITDHKLPDGMSSCHRIKAKVLKIEKPEIYEKLILWHPKRKLQIVNFQGSVDKRPMQAATYSTLRYYASSNPVNGKVKIAVESLFDVKMSYFKHSFRDSLVLEHEQKHFDITEIYARKFRKEIIENYTNYRTFEANHEATFVRIFQELSLKQDEYDSEVYADESIQTKWDQWTAEELKKSAAYRNTTIELSRN